MPRLQGSPSSSVWNAADYVNQLYGDFVAADPSTVPLITRPIQAVARNQCERWSADPSAWAGIPFGPGTMEDMCGTYLGNQGYSLPTVNPPQFSGGQCSGVEYIVSFEGRAWSGSPIAGQWVQQSSQHPGPIGGFSGPVPSAGNPAIPAMVLSHGLDQFQKTSSEFSGFDAIRNVSVARVDNNPDNCGDLPGSYDPGPTPAPDPGPNFTINLGDFNLDIVVDGVNVDVDGKISIPFTINNDITLDLFGDKSGDGGSQQSSAEPGPVQDSNLSGELEAEEGRAIRAVRVTIIDPYNSGTDVGLQGGEILKIPRHANLTFEDSAGYETDAFNVRVNGQRIECPFLEGAKRVRVTPNEGVRLFFQLLYFPR